MKKEGDLLASAKLTSKNQITIPKGVREQLDVTNGDTLVFYIDKDVIKISNKKNCKVEVEDIDKQIGIRKEDNNE